MRAFPVLAALLVVCVAVGGAAPAYGAGDAPARAVPSTGTGVGSTPSTDAPTAGGPGAPAATTVAANATNATEEVNVSRVLSLPSGSTPASAIEAITVDAGVAVSFGTNASAARMETLALRERVRRAETEEARSQALLDGMNDVEKRAVTLRTRYRSEVRSYADGETTATDLVVELARISAEADALAHRVRVLSTLAEDVEGFSIDSSRTQSLLYDLQTFGGPATDRAVAALRGTEDPTRLYVAATGANVTLTTVTGGEFVREAYRADLRRLDGSTIQPEVAQSVTARSYPEIWAAKTSTSGSGRGGTFLYRVAYPGGRLTTFVDGGSERVFKEYQRINLTTFPSGPVANNTQNGLTLSVNRTYAGGPLRISLVKAATGEPVDATVQLGRGGDSVTVGQTGDDGVLWTLSPREQYYVTAVQTTTASAAIVDTSAVAQATVAEAFDAGDVGSGGNAGGNETTTASVTEPQ